MSVSEAQMRKGRRPHHKSRLGCFQCKHRKVKCDESQPQCLNCAKNHRQCIFPTGPDSTAAAVVARPQRSESYPRGVRFASGFDPSITTSCRSDPASASDDSLTQSDSRVLLRPVELPERIMRLVDQPTAPGSMSYVDLELWHHYYLMIAPKSAKIEPGQCFWRDELPKIGFQHHHILHLLLGLSGLHMARYEQARRAELLRKADEHYATGVQISTTHIRSMHSAGMKATWFSSVLICLHNLAMGPQPGQYLAFSDHGAASFLQLLRGLRSVETAQWQSVYPQPPEHLHKLHAGASTCPVPGTGRGVGYAKHFQDLQAAIMERSTGSLAGSIYADLKALTDLQSFFHAAYGPVEMPGVAGTANARTRIVFAWVYSLSTEFLSHLQLKASPALAIFSCFAVLLKEAESEWFIQGWPSHILHGVLKFIDNDYVDLIQWPIAQVLTNGSGPIRAVEEY